jgi:NADPH:quinone reductase-like Zn-dependent oxidoreductase
LGKRSDDDGPHVFPINGEGVEKMRVAGIAQIGGPVTLLNLPEPRSLAADEVRFNVITAGVGNWDDLVRTGDWDVGASPPMALGVEAAGIVTEVGGMVKDFGVGDEVLTHSVPLRENGFWAEKAVANAAHLAIKPANFSWREAAACPVPALVAVEVLADSLCLRCGDSLLVNGAGGTTGGLVVQLAVAMGLTVVATASDSDEERLRRFGAHAVVNYRDPNWPIEAQRVIGAQGFTAAVNTARGGAAATIPAIADGGQLATITGDPPLAERGVVVKDVYVRPDGRQLGDLAKLFDDGQLSVTIGATFGLDEAAEALDLSASGHADGAVVLAVSDIDPIPRIRE